MFPDVDAMVLRFLGPVGVPVHMGVPEKRPVEFIVARRNGGGAVNRVLDRVVVTVDCWAGSSARAAEVAGVARSRFLGEYTVMPLVRGVSEVSGPYSVPDVDTESPRYRFSVELMVRALRD